MKNLLLKGALLGLIATNLSFLVAQGNVNVLYVMRGFPVPFLAFNGCYFLSCQFSGSQAPTFYLQYAWADFVIWLAIGIGVLLLASQMNTRRRSGFFLALGSASGLGISLLTLLSRPLSLYTPTVGFGSRAVYMGFPLEYLMHITSPILPLVRPGTTTYFSAANFAADYILWFLVSLAFIGFLANRYSHRLPKEVQNALIESTISESRKSD